MLALDEDNAALGSRVEELRSAVGQRGRAIERLEILLKYPANPDTPPPANSLEWNVEKRKGWEARQPEGDAPAGRRGGNKSRAGASRRHSPEGIARRGFGRRQAGGREARAGRCVRVRGTHGGRGRARARHHDGGGPARRRPIRDSHFSVRREDKV